MAAIKPIFRSKNQCATLLNVIVNIYYWIITLHNAMVVLALGFLFQNLFLVYQI